MDIGSFYIPRVFLRCDSNDKRIPIVAFTVENTCKTGENQLEEYPN